MRTRWTDVMTMRRGLEAIQTLEPSSIAQEAGPDRRVRFRGVRRTPSTAGAALSLCAKRARAGLTAAAWLGALCVASPAFAQDPAQPPPGFEQQPPATQPQPPIYGQPPPGGYYPPPGYGYGVPPSPMLGPKKMDYEEGDPIPPGYHVETKVRKGLLIGGACTFGVMYLLSALTAAAVEDVQNVSSTGSRDDYIPLYIPAAGPFVTIGTAHSSGVGTFFLVVDGIAQSGGLAMAIIGIAAPNSVLIRNDVGKPGIQLTPMMVGKDIRGTSTMGLGLVGTM